MPSAGMVIVREPALAWGGGTVLGGVPLTVWGALEAVLCG